MVIDQLVKLFGASAAHPLDFLQKDWSTENWIGYLCVYVFLFWSGAYFGLLMPGNFPESYLQYLVEPFGKIHWAGTETATEWCGYMEGAVQSGQRAAMEIINSDAGNSTESLSGQHEWRKKRLKESPLVIQLIPVARGNYLESPWYPTVIWIHTHQCLWRRTSVIIGKKSNSSIVINVLLCNVVPIIHRFETKVRVKPLKEVLLVL